MGASGYPPDAKTIHRESAPAYPSAGSGIEYGWVAEPMEQGRKDAKRGIAQNLVPQLASQPFDVDKTWCRRRRLLRRSRCFRPGPAGQGLRVSKLGSAVASDANDTDFRPSASSIEFRYCMGLADIWPRQLRTEVPDSRPRDPSMHF